MRIWKSMYFTCSSRCAEAEVFAASEVKGPELQVIKKHYRKVRKELPSKLPEHLPVEVVEHVQYTYACRNCEKEETTVPVVKAPVTKPLSGSFAAVGAISHIVNQKFVMGVPLYRQEQEWKRQGIALSRQTMSNWVLWVTEELPETVYQAIRKQLLRREVLHADETILQVLRELGKTAQSKSYMWLYRTSGDTAQGLSRPEGQGVLRQALRP